MQLAQQLTAQFKQVLGIDWTVPGDLKTKLDMCASSLGREAVLPAPTRRGRLLALVSSKLGLNDDSLRAILDEAAANRVILNFHQKNDIASFLDGNDAEGFKSWMTNLGVSTDAIAKLGKAFVPLNEQEVVVQLGQHLLVPKISRSDARECSVEERRNEFLRSLFGGFIFESFQVEAVCALLNSHCALDYKADYYEHLQVYHHDVLNRDRTLTFVVVNEAVRATVGVDLTHSLFELIKDEYQKLSNHGYLAFLVDPFRNGNESGEWNLYADLVLYAEKHLEVNLKAGFFNPRKIEEATRSHIKHIDVEMAKFSLANEGFHFVDCIVIPQDDAKKPRTTDSPCKLLIVFQKNRRDETIIPCPACRSLDVRGNSYPSIGVKSWECQNLICPKRSAFDRGYRFSVAALIKRQAISSDENRIPEESLKRWKLDLVPGASEDECLEVMVRHFTLHGDSIHLIGSARKSRSLLGRKITRSKLDRRQGDSPRDKFFESSLFNRFAIPRPRQLSYKVRKVPSGHEAFDVFLGDAFEVLATLGDGSIDGAATSPPYYNARSYSTWPNIYAYLYDMFNVGRQVFRTLKPGAYYLFNIFDYFDNEHSIVYSAMGKKRMILGPYIVEMFRRIGFELQGNIVWSKGEIEGKRNFNQGNHSPYYQLPLNCWEHIFVFRKPGGDAPLLKFPTVLHERPVIKMIRGENVLGHTAPYPEAIPDQLFRQLQAGSTVLDPFGGSMTSARAARRRSLRSICIDIHQEYCDLGIRLYDLEAASDVAQLSLI